MLPTRVLEPLFSAVIEFPASILVRVPMSDFSSRVAVLVARMGRWADGKWWEEAAVRGAGDRRLVVVRVAREE